MIHLTDRVIQGNVFKWYLNECLSRRKLSRPIASEKEQELLIRKTTNVILKMFKTPTNNEK